MKKENLTEQEIKNAYEIVCNDLLLYKDKRYRDGYRTVSMMIVETIDDLKKWYVGRFNEEIL